MEAVRVNRSLFASVEKAALSWLARRLPRWIHSDHLTLLGFVSLIGVGASYWFARYSKLGLLLGNIAAWTKPLVQLAGHQFQLFDVGGAIGIAGMVFAFLWTIARNIAHLYRAEPLSS